MKWVAIDFGSSYSSSSIMMNDEPVKVHPIGGLYNMYGFPTVAYVDDDKNIKVCNDALSWRCQNPEHFLKDFKLSIHEGDIPFMGVSYLEIVAEILKVIKSSAQIENNGEVIDCTIITYPSSFSNIDPRIDIMREAAQKAGFKEVKFIKEAEAAAIYYDYLKISRDGTISLVYDLGGGTFDAALIQHNLKESELIGVSSGTICGGQQFETAIYKYLNTKYKFEYDSNENLRFLQIDSIVRTCKEMKESLSINEKVAYPEPLLGKLVVELDRQTFNGLIEPLLEKTLQECTSMIHSSGKSWTDISQVILIGGSCAIPYVRELIEKFLKGQNASATKILHNKSDENIQIDSLFAVSIGALLSIENRCKKEKSNIKVADSYYIGNEIPKNLLKAAYYYNLEYQQNEDERILEKITTIFQTIVDNLEIEDGCLTFNSILDYLGEDAADEIVDILIKLQNEFENEESNVFVANLFKLEFWIEIINQTIDVE